MLNESHVEQSLIQFLVEQGYEHFYGPNIAPFGRNPKRETLDTVILEEEVQESLRRLNPDVPELALQEGYHHLVRLSSQDIMANNELFHRFLSEGLRVEHTENGQGKGVHIRLLDMENIENNRFWVVNQFTIKENNFEKRLDVVLFINGFPLVVIELKNATDEKATLEKAYTQIQNYKNAVPKIFYYNALCIISDGVEARVSSLSAPFTRYLAWKSPEKQENGILPEMEIMAERMLEKTVLLHLIRYNTVFEDEEKRDEKTGVFSIVKSKKIAAYHQYYAVEKAVQETLRASHEQEGNRKIGVIWHTQGSGKSLTMVFYAGRIVVEPSMQNPTLVILTDRNDLDDQLFATFGSCQNLLRQKPVQAESREHLKELLKVAGGGIIFTTIQKFAPSEGNVYETLSSRANIVVVADEAHRSQYGFKGREVSTSEGSEIRYGNAKYLRDALPQASFVGFTGTPIEKEDKSTRAVFGDEIDIYDIEQAVVDGATVRIYYESRLAKIKWDEGALDKIDTDIEEIEDATEEQKEKAKKNIATMEAIIGHPERLKDIAKDIVEHFEARQEIFEGKAMVVCMSRNIAVKLYDQMIALRPDWHNDALDKGALKVVMTSSSDDPESFQAHHTNKENRKTLSSRFKNPKDSLQMILVRDMWLTGFDVPCLHTMYIDKRMKGANLMQAIARVNRVYKDKPGGFIVDYIGIGQDLRNAMGIYTESGGHGEATIDIKELIASMKTHFEIVEQMFHGFPYKNYFRVKSAEKFKILLGALNFIVQNEDLKTRFLKEVTTLSKLFAMAVPHFEAEVIRDDIAFFQAVKARINKFTPGEGKSNQQVETAIRQIVEEALASDGVIDIFEAAGMKSPSLDILSEAFLLEVKNMEQKHLAFELLKKLIHDEVQLRKRQSITQGKKFSEMLSSIIQRYHNNQIDTAQVIQELSEMAQEMNLETNKAKNLGLSEEEYAFYSILAENQSTKYLEDHKMKELIHYIVETVRKSADGLWQKREDIRAKLRLTVRKTLMRYGYPPDLAQLEADKVLEQSELLAENLSQS